MHEVSIAENIIQIVLQSLGDRRKHSVKRVQMQVGELAGVMPDSLEFCYQVLADDPALKGSILEIERVALSIRCNRCMAISGLSPWVFNCPRCASNDLTILTGDEMHIVAIELEATGEDLK